MKIPYFDAHCDTITACGRIGCTTGHVDLKRLEQYAPVGQIFAICAEPEFLPGYQKYLPILLKELAENEDRVMLCRSGADIRKAADTGKIAALIAVEGGEHLGCSLEGLQRAHELGVRSVNLTWNFDNALSGAAAGSGSGLTDLGRQFVCLAQELGVIVDLSHASERAFWDTMEIIKRPVYASHSDAKALTPAVRNLTDAQFCALVRCGGGAGINLYADFLGLTRDIDAVVAHIEHFWALGGEKAVFLGTDFDGIDHTPKKLTGVERMDLLYEALLRRNYPEQLVQDLFYRNLRNILERAL